MSYATNKFELNRLFLNRALTYIPETFDGKPQATREHVATLVKNLSSLGFMPSNDLLTLMLNEMSVEALARFEEIAVPILTVKVGAHVKYEPMYPNFPKQVMEASGAELFINAILHYIFGVLPDYEVEKRDDLDELTKCKFIKAGTFNDLSNMMSNLMSSKTSISESDKDDIQSYLMHTVALADIPVMDHKENMCYVLGLLNELNHPTYQGFAKDNLRTATDVLRYATAISDGDVSLAENTKFVNFKRSERKFFLEVLEGLNKDSVREDMQGYKQRWIRLGEILHPGDYADKYPNTFYAFSALRENEKIETFGSRVHSGTDVNTIKALAKRPGMLARKLDYLVRNGSQKEIDLTLDLFAKVAEKVSVPVLCQVYTHFKNRDDKNGHRIFFPKGNVSKFKVIKNELKDISRADCAELKSIAEVALGKHFKAKEELGKVWVDEALKDYFVPFSQRSASKALKTVVRGSRLPLESEDFVRFFVHWKNIGKHDTVGANYDHTGKRVDLDLSGIAFTEDWKKQEHISYTRLRSEGMNACHSGDITDAPKGASEFIDFDVKGALKAGYRYIMPVVLSYTHQPFSAVPEAFMGWMNRKESMSGEIYKPKTVDNILDLNSEATRCVPMIIDLREQKVIWLDMGMTSKVMFQNNVETNMNSLALLGKTFTEMKKMNLYDLFTIHGEARGEIVESKEEADYCFGVDETDINPYDVEMIMSEYL